MADCAHINIKLKQPENGTGWRWECLDCHATGIFQPDEAA